MKKNQIIALGLSLIVLYGIIEYLTSAYELFKDIDDYSSTSISFGFYKNFFIHLFYIAALVQFFLSRYTRSGLLRIALQYGIFSWIIFFPIWIVDNLIFNQDVPDFSLFYVILSLSITGFKCFALHSLVRKSIPLLEPLGDGNHTFSEVRKRDRFFHRIFDVSIVALVVLPAFEYIVSFMIKVLQSENAFSYFAQILLQSDRSMGIFMCLFIITLYYLTTEGGFNTSIGKTIMGNMVVDHTGAHPGIGQRLGRTFSRLIPFEAVSFLFGWRGWHDYLTDTYVVKTNKSKENILEQQLPLSLASQK